MYIEPDDKDLVCRECCLLNQSLAEKANGNSVTGPNTKPNETPVNGTLSFHSVIKKCAVCVIWTAEMKWLDGEELCLDCYGTFSELDSRHAYNITEEDLHGHAY